MSVEDEFNLDLELIETWLKRQEPELAALYVQPAMKMPDLIKRPLSRDTVFVMPLEDIATPDAAISQFSVQQLVTDKFGVLIGVNGPGSAQGIAGKDKVKILRRNVKRRLIGLKIPDFDPLYYRRGGMLDVNTKTQNLLYQLEFVTSRTVVTGVKQYV